MRQERLGRLDHVGARHLEVHAAARRRQRVQGAPAVAVVDRDEAGVLREDRRHVEVQAVHLAQRVQARVQERVVLGQGRLLNLDDDRAILRGGLARADERERGPQEVRHAVAVELRQLVDGVERLELELAVLVVVLDGLPEGGAVEAAPEALGQALEEEPHRLHELVLGHVLLVERAPALGARGAQHQVGVEAALDERRPVAGERLGQSFVVVDGGDGKAEGLPLGNRVHDLLFSGRLSAAAY